MYMKNELLHKQFSYVNARAQFVKWRAAARRK